MSNFIIDKDVTKKVREAISESVLKKIDGAKHEISNRTPIINKRRDFYEGRHDKWTNVSGQASKKQAGHILATFNYILRFCQKIVFMLANQPPKIKIVPKDEANEIEVLRSEALEEAVRQVFKDNKFFPVKMEKLSVSQVRDGDFVIDVRVVKDEISGENKIVITPNEDVLKVSVGWDDASGTSFSFVAFTDLWSLDKIKREYDFEAEPVGDEKSEGTSRGSHTNDQYGIFADTSESSDTSNVPDGISKLPKARITDYWGWEIIDGKAKIVNLIYVNQALQQFIVTDYTSIPKEVGHSMVIAGKPWSMSFIDPLIDPQLELNDRTSEEGDLVRIGSYSKFLVVNMPDFDQNSIKPGSGQVIFLEGDDVDFRPLQMATNPAVSEAYLNRIMEHMFNLGLPKIALSAGTAPYTGRVAAIQYQPVSDIIQNYRGKWDEVFDGIIKKIQQYLIDYFPETHSFMRESLLEGDTYTDGELVIRDVEIDWDNILPLSRSDKVVDASTLRDRGAISLSTYLEQVGFKDPAKEIKKMKSEHKDEELMVLLQKFNEFSPGAVKATISARQEMMKAEEQMGVSMEAQSGGKQTQSYTAPVKSSEQNESRGIMSSSGTPTGQTASARGAVAQTSQNLNAKSGV